MRRRWAAGMGRSSSTSPASVSGSRRPSDIAAMRLCSSRSRDMAGLLFAPDAVRGFHFLQQLLQRRDVAVAFDQGGNGAEAGDRLAIEVPHLGADRRAVIVDAD